MLARICIYPKMEFTFISIILICFFKQERRIKEMNYFKQYSNYVLMSTLFAFTLFAAGCGSDDTPVTPDAPTALIPPTVVSTSPADADKNASLNGSITALFDTELDASTTKTTFTLKNGTAAVEGNVSYANNAILFNPDANLTASTDYNATITTGVTDLNGTAMASDYVWNFTTGTLDDNASPFVVSRDPNATDTNVSINRSVTVLFNETLDPSTVSTSTFTLAPPSGSDVNGTVSYSGKTIVLNPTENLSKDINYTATITTDVKDLAGNPLATAEVWSFTTGASETVARPVVKLGTAGDFVILSKTAISTTGTTKVIGDIGVSPVSQTAITGFDETRDASNEFATSVLVTGKIYASDYATPTPAKMTKAISDMQTAYTDAAGRTLPDFTELGSGNVSGMTLAPGLYKWSNTVLIQSDVTISGSATDVWIFQIAGDLTMASGVHVTLAGGALAKNIFWQVAGGAGVTLGTGSVFNGVVLTDKAINPNTGAKVNGRLLAQTAVSLNANTVTEK
jgi:hypothetical protein